MGGKLESIAKTIEYEEVTAKGHLDLDVNVLEVKKISVTQANEPLKPIGQLEDLTFIGDDYERTIAQRGKLEPSLDYLAS